MSWVRFIEQMSLNIDERRLLIPMTGILVAMSSR